MSSKYLIGSADGQFIFNDEIKAYLFRIETAETTSPYEFGWGDTDKGVWLTKQLRGIGAKLGPFMRSKLINPYPSRLTIQLPQTPTCDSFSHFIYKDNLEKRMAVWNGSVDSPVAHQLNQNVDQ